MFGIGTVSQTAIDPNYVFTVDTSITESGYTTSNTEFKFFTQNTSATATGSILWEEVGDPSNNGNFNWDASISGVSPTITFPSMGVYKVTVPNTIDWGYPRHSTATVYYEVQKIIEINNWGNHIFPSLNYGFYRGVNLKIKAQDAPIFDSSFDLDLCFYRGTNTGSFEDVSGSLSIWNIENCNSLYQTFMYCKNFNIDISTWDTSNVTSLQQTFRYCGDFNQNINTHEVIQSGRTYNAWDVSNVTDFYLALASNPNATTITGSFNQPLNNWDVRKATTLSSLFANQTLFNQDIGNWVPESCSIMTKLFYNCQAFNQNINSWDVSKNTKLDYTFFNAEAFNQPLNSWDTSQVTTMAGTFSNAHEFNQPLNDWDTGQATTFLAMFYHSPKFNQDISSWDTINLTTAEQMFYAPTSTGSKFNNGAGVGVATYLTSSVFTKHGRTYTAWDTRNIANTYLMLAGRNGQNTGSFNADISNWDTSNITNFRAMFQRLPYFNQPLNTTSVTVGGRTYNAWNVSKGTEFREMFRSSTLFNQPLGKWQINTGSNVNLATIFYGATSFNQDISASLQTVGSSTYTAWDTKKVTDFNGMFYNTPFNKSISNWNTVSGSSMYQMFRQNTVFNQPLNTNQVTIGSETYNAWDTKNVTNFQEMLYFASAFNQDVSKWNTSKATNLNRLFGTSGFNQSVNTNQVTVGSETYNAWDVSNVINFAYTFDATGFNQPIGNWQINTGSNVSMLATFRNTTAFNQDISSSIITVGGNTYTAWDTQKVTTLFETFYNADTFNKPIGNWNTSNVTSLQDTFYGAQVFNQDISSSVQTVGSNTYISWDTEKVTSFYRTLTNAYAFSKSIRNWNTISGSTFYQMFTNCDSFNHSLATQSVSINSKNWTSWNISNSTSGSTTENHGANLKQMFNNMTIYDGTGLSSWNIESASFDNAFASTTTFSTANYDALLTSWAGQVPVWSGSIHFGNSQYTGTPGNAASASRVTLKDTYNWTITDGGPV